MNVFATDSQIVGETSSTLFTVTPANGVAISFWLQNVGVNVLVFTLQGSNNGGGTWTNLDNPGGTTNSTLVSGQSTSFVVNSSYAQLQLIGYASGGSILNYTQSFYVNRASGGGLLVLPN